MGEVYYRFIMHLKLFAQRLLLGTMHEEDDEESLLDIIRMKYQSAYTCVQKIEAFIFAKYNYTLTDDEKVYLTIHIHRLVFKSNNN